MIRNSLSDNAALENYDVIVVGSGPAGITCANELSKGGQRVLVLEKGSSANGDRSKAKARKILVTGNPYAPISEQITQKFGGTSQLWGGNCIPFEQSDFSEIKSRPSPKWPFSYTEYLKLVRRAEGLLGIETSSDWGGDKRQNPDDTNLVWKFWKFCSYPFRFGEEYKDSFKDADNLDIVLDSTLQSVTSKGDTIVEVLVSDSSGNCYSIAAKNIVFALGGIENALTLMQLVQDKKLDFNPNNHSLGRYFSEHPNLVIGTLTGANLQKVWEEVGEFELEGVIHKPGLVPTMGFLQTTECNNFIVSVWRMKKIGSVINDLKDLSIEFEQRGFNKNLIKGLAKLCLTPRKLIGTLLKYRQEGSLEYEYREDELEVRLMLESLATPESYLTFGTDDDRSDSTLAQLHWSLDDRDIESMHTAADMIEDYFEKAFNLVFTRTSVLTEGKSKILPLLNTGGHYGHHMATTRLDGPNHPGILDQTFRPLGLENLYIAGSSTFPTVSFANPTLTIVAVSLFIADKIIEKQQRSVT